MAQPTSVAGTTQKQTLKSVDQFQRNGPKFGKTLASSSSDPVCARTPVMPETRVVKSEIMISAHAKDDARLHRGHASERIEVPPREQRDYDRGEDDIGEVLGREQAASPVEAGMRATLPATMLLIM